VRISLIKITLLDQFMVRDGCRCDLGEVVALFVDIVNRFSQVLSPMFISMVTTFAGESLSSRNALNASIQARLFEYVTRS
jgi:hypothetical protein